MIIVALCAGMGKRMQQDRPKPLVPFLDGTSMISRLCHEFYPNARLMVLVIQSRHLALFQKDLSAYPLIRFVFQEEQLGTGHAFQLAIDDLRTHDLLPSGDNVICLYGDTPLVPLSLLNTLSHNPQLTKIVTCFLNSPFGYGRIIQDGPLVRIVEEKDCSDKERRIQQVNMGIYSFSTDDLWKVPFQFSTNNAQQEMYLTEYISHLQQQHCAIALHVYDDKNVWRLQGVNCMDDLRQLEDLYHQRSS